MSYHLSRKPISIVKNAKAFLDCDISEHTDPSNVSCRSVIILICPICDGSSISLKIGIFVTEQKKTCSNKIICMQHSFDNSVLVLVR